MIFLLENMLIEHGKMTALQKRWLLTLETAVIQEQGK